MQQHGYLRGVTLQEAQQRLESGVLYQQLVRARSNASFIGIRPDPYYRQEFEAALTSLAKLLIR